MVITLGFEECMKDSPTFRDNVQQADGDIQDLENLIDKVMKHCSVAVDTGKVYNNATKSFIGSVNDVADSSKDDEFVQGALKRFTSTMMELTEIKSTLFDQAQRLVKTQFNNFLRDEVRSAREAKKGFDRISEDYATALSKHAAVSRLKPYEVEEAALNLTSTRNCFRSISMDYVCQINMLHKQKRFQSVDKMLSYMHALFTFFHQGYDLMKELEPFMKTVSSQLEDLCKTTEAERQSMVVEQERHQSMSGDSGIYMKCVSDAIIIEGHLFKRASNAFKTWNRRWFTIKDNKLFYQKRKDDMTVVVDDIRLVTVRPNDDVERRFCFEIISPGKSFLLQAESDDARLAWVKAIQSSIGAAFKETMEAPPQQQTPTSILASNKATNSVSTPLARTSSYSSNQTTSPGNGATQKKGDGGNKTSFLENGSHNTMAKIYQVPGNGVCADCRRSEPRWASISLGVTLCIECSGVHRSLGVHVSKVRSLTLDQWEPEAVKIMMRLGNDRVNEIYNANLTPERAIKPNCSITDRQAHIKAKYVDREFVMSIPAVLNRQPAHKGAKGQRYTRWAVSSRRKVGQPPASQSPAKHQESIKNEILVAEQASSSGVAKLKMASKRDSLFEQEELSLLFSYFDQQESDGVNDDIIVFGPSSTYDSIKDLGDVDVMDVSKLHPDVLLYKATEAANLPVMLLARSNKADLNWSNDEDEGRTALMQAAIVGSIPACEYLLVNGGKISTVDGNQRTALHYAAMHNQIGVACQLLKRKIELDVVDSSGKTALEIAVDNANADIVTLIRLKKMNDQMKEDSSSGYQTDALVNDVFRDFSSRAFSSIHSPDAEDSKKTFSILGSSSSTPPKSFSPSRVPPTVDSPKHDEVAATVPKMVESAPPDGEPMPSDANGALLDLESSV